MFVSSARQRNWLKKRVVAHNGLMDRVYYWAGLWLVIPASYPVKFVPMLDWVDFGNDELFYARTYG